MFGWLHPKCPLAADDQHWIEWRMTWLADQFGLERVRRRAVILPTDEFFPEPYEATTEGVRRLLDRVARYMEVEPGRVDLDFYSRRKPVAFNAELIDPHSGAAGIYDERSGRITIWLEVANLADPVDVVATLSHELAHVHLLGDRRISDSEPDHEPLTDLLTVFLGLGVFTANAVLRDRNWHAGQWEDWSVARKGYLTARLFGYALALFAWYRGERSPGWVRHLRLDAGDSLKKGLRFLEHVRAPTTPSRRAGPPLPPGAFAAAKETPAIDLFVAAEEGAIDGGEEANVEIDPDSADGCIMRGVAHASQGDLDAALQEYSRAIELDPTDAEAYVLRGQLFLQLDRCSEALSDAVRAVRLEPDDVEAHRLRGAAHLRTSDPDRAISDFSFVLRQQRQDAAAYYQRGLAHAARRDFGRAVADFGKAIRYAPTTADYYLARAEAYQQLGERRKALADAEEFQRRSTRLALD
jgi:tetratricopeptide (TPR) repeat protein